jgi:hypothetical protein
VEDLLVNKLKLFDPALYPAGSSFLNSAKADGFGTLGRRQFLTNKTVLAKLSTAQLPEAQRVIPGHITLFRSLSKLTFCALDDYVPLHATVLHDHQGSSAATCRVSGCIFQTTVETGRLSMAYPCLQTVQKPVAYTMPALDSVGSQSQVLTRAPRVFSQPGGMQAMQQLRMVTSGTWGGRSLTRPFRDARRIPPYTVVGHADIIHARRESLSIVQGPFFCRPRAKPLNRYDSHFVCIAVREDTSDTVARVLVWQAEGAQAFVNVRRAFVAPAGYCVVSADFCQLELRLMAHFSGDAVLMCMLNDPEWDPFVRLASKWKVGSAALKIRLLARSAALMWLLHGAMTAVDMTDI